LCVAVSCARTAATKDATPHTEFLLGSADSTFWIASTDGQMHVRGAPLTLARVGEHFYELYTADDDYSYDDALLLGQRLYRRDIATGDSTLIYADTSVARIAATYARTHPDEQPLGPDDEGEANPSTTATAQIDVLDVIGPYLTYEYHLDVDLPSSRPWHTTRRGVIDVRTGKQATVADLFGAAAARALTAGGRRVYESTRDSILAARPSTTGEERDAADALLRLQFDEKSFVISAVDGKPAIEFDVPGRGQGPAGNVIELDPVTVDPTPWWRDVQATLPTMTREGDDRWTRGAISVVARYDTSGEVARVTLSDSTKREWPVATILGPLRQITWLDAPQLGAADRAALRRAFNTAASYDEASRVASLGRTSRTPSLAYASVQACLRKPARNLRAHDAGACQQHGSRVRRGRPVDDGQGRRDRRLSAQPRQHRDRVDRPRRFSRADSPRRSGRDEVQRQLRRANLDGSRRAR
jgi:hypothetical protein